MIRRFGSVLMGMMTTLVVVGCSSHTSEFDPEPEWPVAPEMPRRMTEANQAPIADAGPDQFSRTQGQVELDGRASHDPDNPDTNELDFRWTQIDGPLVTLLREESAQPRFVAPDEWGTLEFELRVFDGVDESLLPDTVVIRVGNRVPIADAGADFVVSSGEITTLRGNRSRDEDGDEIEVVWEQLTGTSVTIESAGEPRARFIAPTETGQLSFMITVSDAFSSARDTVTIIVAADDYIDSDGDLLTDDLERELGTGVDDPDTDRDGIPDGWEVLGYEGVDYASIGCSPLHRDILLEVDFHEYMREGRLHSARLSDAIMTRMKDYFASLTIRNPDGIDGINIFFFHDTPLDEEFHCYTDGAGGHHSPRNFRFRHTFRKAQLCIGPFRGNGHITSMNFKLRSRDTNLNPDDDWTERGQFDRYRGILHEIGHNLGLLHGGDENTNFKPNYPSVMNYSYDLKFDGSPATLRDTAIHYSDGYYRDASINECELVEARPFGAVIPAEDLTFLNHYASGFETDDMGNVDWNGDRELSTRPYEMIIRNDRGATRCRVLRDHNDIGVIARRMATPLPSNPR